MPDSNPPTPPRLSDSGSSPADNASAQVSGLVGSLTLGSVLEALLKRPGALLHELNGPRRNPIIGLLVVLILVCGCTYGLVMGSLSGGTQLWAAPMKLTVGLFLSMLLCLPSLYIFLCLNGADVRLGQVGGALLGMVALVTLLLIGFAPVAWIFSQSTDSVVMMGILHLFFWVIGLWFGTRMVKGLLAYGDGPDSGHLKVWVIIFVLVSLQMTSVLRPLIGTSTTLLPREKKFFVQHWFDNLEGGGRSR